MKTNSSKNGFLKPKGILLIFILSLCFIYACDKIGISKGDNTHHIDTLIVHDTIMAMPDGKFTYNLPCKVVNIHQEKAGKSILFIWLHGGVRDRRFHNLDDFNHLDCCEADDSVLKYLADEGVKSIALFPICHKANIDNCVIWKDCFNDVYHMIDDYVNKGIVDPTRIYLAGSSDGGNGTWDFLERQESLFAVAMPMSCANPRKTTIPVYFFNTNSEPDCSEKVNLLNNEGCNIVYKHCAQYKHGGDAAECTKDFLKKFFSHSK